MTPDPVLIHVGLPKTGTTSLQETLRGWPNTAGKPFDRPGGRAARDLQQDARDGTLTGEALDAHLAAARRRDDLPVILSAEAFAGTPRQWFTPIAEPAEMIAQLGTTRGAGRALLTLRRPRPWLRSTYRYTVRGGYAETYDRYLARITADLDAGRGMACWRATAGACDAAFGADAVAVAWFEDLVEDPAAFWAAVATRLGLADLRPLGAVPLPRLNDAPVGPPSFELALNRYLLRSELHPGRGPRPMTRITYNRRIGSRLVRRSSEAYFTDRTTALEPAVVDRLAAAAEDIARTHGARVPEAGWLRDQ
jgi:hypothetical protein